MQKICFFSGDITRSGGTERVSVMIANALAEKKKYKIIFLSLVEQSKHPFYEIHPEIQRYALGNKWIQPGPGYLKIVPKLRNFLKTRKIDIIIDIDIVLDILSIPAAKRLKTKIISWEHFNCDYEMSVLYRRMILKYSVKHTDYIVTLTNGDKECYKHYLNRQKQITTIYNPMKEHTAEPASEKEKAIVTAVRLVYDKGIDYLGDVAEEVLKNHPDWKWYLLGDGELRESICRIVKEKGLEGRLIVMGKVPDVENYLKRACLFVLTSRVEGLPMCLLEAKEYGLPCVSFDIKTGPSDIIEDGVNGFLIPPFQCSDMIEKIHLLIEDEKLRNEFAAHASDGIGKFQMSAVLGQWEELLQTVGGESGV